jgi:hypothetical protein
MKSFFLVVFSRITNSLCRSFHRRHHDRVHLLPLREPEKGRGEGVGADGKRPHSLRKEGLLWV